MHMYFGLAHRKRSHIYIPYLVSVLLLVRLLPQLPVDVQLAVEHGRRAGAQGGEQQARQHQACERDAETT